MLYACPRVFVFRLNFDHFRLPLHLLLLCICLLLCVYNNSFITDPWDKIVELFPVATGNILCTAGVWHTGLHLATYSTKLFLWATLRVLWGPDGRWCRRRSPRYVAVQCASSSIPPFGLSTCSVRLSEHLESCFSVYRYTHTNSHSL